MPINSLYIDRQVARLEHVRKLKTYFRVPIKIIDNPRDVFGSVLTADDPVKRGKEVLYLTRNKGKFIKDCPGTRSYLCCGYRILHIGSFCVMDCSYCILQTYFHPPLLQLFVNRSDMLDELDSFFKWPVISRIGTGEFTDSLIWERWGDLSAVLVPKFAGQSRAVLELKTKTTAIEHLRNLSHHRKTIVSWSLNTPRVIENEERKTASLSSRLQAAATCASWGYRLGFHFDPLILYEGCEEEYRQVVKALFAHISADNIIWISLGGLRYMPSLEPIIKNRFPGSKIIYHELIPGLDGKMRYFKPLRLRLYRRMVNWIRDRAPDVLIYLCMEDEETWQETLGFIPASYGGLAKMLDDRAIRMCDLRLLK